MKKPIAYLGIDLHKEESVFTLLDQNGQVLVAAERVKREEFIQKIKAYQEKYQLKVVLEPLGFHYPYYRALKEMDLEVYLNQPRKTKILAYGQIKTDAIDAYHLARLLYLQSLPQSQIEIKDYPLKRLVHYYFFPLRKQLVKVKQTLRVLLLDSGLVITASNILSEKAKAEIKKAFPKLEAATKEEILSLYQIGLSLQKKRQRIGKFLEKEAEKRKEVQILTSIPGIGKLTAFAILLEIGNLNRFPTKESFVNFIGLRPIIKQSGSKYWSGSLVFKKNRLLKYLFYQTAIRIKPTNAPELYLFYQRLKNKGKPEKMARVALARKIAILAYILLKKNQFYQREKVLLAQGYYFPERARMLP